MGQSFQNPVLMCRCPLAHFSPTASIVGPATWRGADDFGFYQPAKSDDFYGSTSASRSERGARRPASATATQNKSFSTMGARRSTIATGGCPVAFNGRSSQATAFEAVGEVVIQKKPGDGCGKPRERASPAGEHPRSMRRMVAKVPELDDFSKPQMPEPPARPGAGRKHVARGA